MALVIENKFREYMLEFSSTVLAAVIGFEQLESTHRVFSKMSSTYKEGSTRGSLEGKL